MGAEPVVAGAPPPPLSSFIQLGLETDGDGLGKAGLELERVEPREGLLRGSFGPGPLASDRCEGGGFMGICCLLPIKGLLLMLVSSCVVSNLLAMALPLFDSRTTVSPLVGMVFFQEVGLGGIFIALPERHSEKGFLV